jgi:orotidine-5'-phosphate decarboxylase
LAYAPKQSTEKEQIMAEKRNFFELLGKRWNAGTFACVGLDSDYDKIPEVFKKGSVAETISLFNKEIVDATYDLVCAYKPNIAFYEPMGSDGLLGLRRTINYIHEKFPEIPVILDFKRADIGNTNIGYVKAGFGEFNADAVTVHPYLGAEALKPFLDLEGKGIIVLCRTSNPGAGEFQDLIVTVPEGQMPLYQYVAHRVAKVWNKNGNCLVVAGATYPEELGEVRRLVGDMGILIPGVGKQQAGLVQAGGRKKADLEGVVRAGQDSRGQGMIINSSREIIFASSGNDFDEAARIKTIELRDGINKYRQAA